MTEAQRGTPEYYETFGRVMEVLLDCTPLGSSTARGLRVWQVIPSGFGLDWTGGPHAMEIARALQQAADDVEMTHVLSPGDVSDIAERAYGDGVSLRVRGLLLQLRPTDTIGEAGERELVVARMRQAASSAG